MYSIDLAVTDEARVVKHAKGRVQRVTERHYQIPEHEKGHMKLRPVVIGSGPAGLFCAYLLALEGCCPLIAERGAPVRERKADVERFWKTGVLDPSSNVQFGEGGAGTFSDGETEYSGKRCCRERIVLSLRHLWLSALRRIFCGSRNLISGPIF